MLRIESSDLADESRRMASRDEVFAESDRLCRTGRASAVGFARRALARAALGDAAGAGADLDRARQQEPDDPFALRAAMWIGDPDARRSAAARWLAGEASDPAGFAAAAILQLDAGAEIAVQWRRRGDALVGQAAWRGEGELVVACDAAGEIRRFRTAAAALEERPDIRCAEIVADGGGAAWLELEGQRVTQRYAPPSPPPETHDAVAASDLHVIVPVYRDLAATRACLESLAPEAEGLAARVVVVDDASPEPELRAYLRRHASRPGVTLLENPENLGFARSVNRALATCAGGDVLLLNADATLPPGALARLRRIAHAQGDIGTVTPFSNNGEFTSFPEAFVANPLPSAEAVGAIAAIAAKVHGARTVDLPNGIGFCLYVTRRCLDAVGPLPVLYRRGYYEDVEFCLRAGERGFRNVGAPGVYVGHAGARSFGPDKRSLVTRNLAALELRFPGHRAEVAAFLSADPLARARRALRAALPAGLTPPERAEGAPPEAFPAYAPAAPLRLGVVAPCADAVRDRRLLRLARRLRAQGVGVRLYVLGGSLNDAELMATGAAFVTGPMPPDDYAVACALYRLGALADLSHRPAAPRCDAFLALAPLPVARAADPRPSRRDLRLPPGDDDALAVALTAWLLPLARRVATA